MAKDEQKKPKTKWLVPDEDRLVPLEGGAAWPVETAGEGENATTRPKPVEVAMSRYYRRRIKDGDLVETKERPISPSAPPPTEEAKTTKTTKTNGSK